ncbi:FadR/GntR family transcriptional regulator [Variovorax sp. OV329]|uniref:FadR/GntR family transcriptional regulator n=1 Tax=Variovorax sp. OV329 TaxID=1882825 RepID=UPI0008E50A4C|nr:FCD domain-containing protein [Variovorax sp. OV329]SFN37515.1 transcriptional regulator, GntR family [Variovorax sp. OV329]
MHSALTLRQNLLENLQARTWRAGHRLPTERELSEQYGLSRSTVRRVLADLKGKGLITQTVGSGTYVSEEVGVALAQIASSASPLATSPAELMSARMVLEPAIVAMVVGNATAADFERMDECCEKGETATSIEDFELWDGKLHEAIADAAHNTFIATVFQRMNEVRAQSEWGTLKRRTATPERRARYELEHRALVAALRDRDGARAAALCLEHLTHVRQNLLGY